MRRRGARDVFTSRFANTPHPPEAALPDDRHPSRLLDFHDRVALVTGAARGIGAGIARRFAAAGAAVVVNYRTSSGQAAELVRAIEADGGRAIAHRADVSQEGDVERLFADGVAAFGRLDVLVNNAGSYPVLGLLEMGAADWDAVLGANLRSVFLCTREAARRMVGAGRGGAIVNIASIEGETPMPLHSHYAAAKAGVLMHTRSTANELGPHGIRVNALCLGLIGREGIEDEWPEGVRRWREACPLGRMGTPEEVGDACLFLASPAARWITGASLRLDGGVMTNRIF